MYSHKKIRALAALTLVVALNLSAAGFQKDKDQKKGEPVPDGTPVLWQDPGDISTRNLLEGPGGEKPDTSNVTYIKDEVGGYSVKYRVKDGAGRTWVAKVGNEARPETAAVRLVWAAGYATEQNHLVPCVKIKGATSPKKKVDRCEGDGFANVRFEARSDDIKRLNEWSWADNPFKDTKEFKGLIIMMALLNNWDLKDSNNKVIYVPAADGGKGELRYIISDLGATFGKTGNFITHSRNEPEKYVKTKFVKSVEGGKVTFHYSGKSSSLFDNVTVEDAKWIGDILSKLTDAQLADAFRAANFTDEETKILVEEVRSRIDELANLPGATPVASESN